MPRTRSRCRFDGSPLVQREDDKPETIRARLDQQLASLGEVVDYYDQAGLLRGVNGVQPIERVAADLVAAVQEPRPTGAQDAR